MLRQALAFSAIFLPFSLLAGGTAAAARAPVTGNSASASALVTKPVLRVGSRGPAVAELQRQLTALRYFDVGTIDGVFGTSTHHAVVAFQKVQGISRDGVVGQVTWARLASPVRPRARYPLATPSLEVDLSHQVVYYVRYGAVQRILDASTGSGAWYYSGGTWQRAITPTGRFRIYWRVNGWHQSPLGWLYRPNYFYKGYAVHGYASVPAYPASHGCVRITIPTMDRMWASMRLGMPVAVYRS